MSTKKEVNGIILILSCQKHKDTRLKEINLKNREDNAIIFLSHIDAFSNSPNPTLNCDLLNSIIFQN